MKLFITMTTLLGAFAVLISLGLWQVDRLQWKNGIIATLNTEYSKDPTQNRLTFKDLQNTNIQYGQIKGRPDYTKEILVGPTTHNKKISYRVITPVKLSPGGYVLVHRGWIAVEDRDKIKQDWPRGRQSFTGIARKPDWNRFTPNNSAENDIWTKLDIDQMTQAKDISNYAPVIFYTQEGSTPYRHITAQTEKWFPRNKHKQYAIFWFTMAGVLVAFSGFYVFHKRSKT